MANKKVILESIASRLNTSKMTVSRALNGQSGVGEALCKEIRLIAAKMGYDFNSSPYARIGFLHSNNS